MTKLIHKEDTVLSVFKALLFLQSLYHGILLLIYFLDIFYLILISLFNTPSKLILSFLQSCRVFQSTGNVDFIMTLLN